MKNQILLVVPVKDWVVENLMMLANDPRECSVVMDDTAVDDRTLPSCDKTLGFVKNLDSFVQPQWKMRKVMI